MNILIAFEESGTVRRAFAAKGHNVWSCDLQPARDNSPNHIQMDALYVIKHPEQFCGANKWDIIIMHPPCTALAVSGNRWYGQGMPKHHERLEAIKWTRALWDFARSVCDKVVLENPVGVIWKHGVELSQYIQPWQFGHGETKKTGLAICGLPNLIPTNIVEGREQNVWKMAPSPTRARDRSKTYEGIAQAMADQWG